MSDQHKEAWQQNPLSCLRIFSSWTVLCRFTKTRFPWWSAAGTHATLTAWPEALLPDQTEGRKQEKETTAIKECVLTVLKASRNHLHREGKTGIACPLWLIRGWPHPTPLIRRANLSFQWEHLILSVQSNNLFYRRAAWPCIKSS